MTDQQAVRLAAALLILAWPLYALGWMVFDWALS